MLNIYMHKGLLYQMEQSQELGVMGMQKKQAGQYMNGSTGLAQVCSQRISKCVKFILE